MVACVTRAAEGQTDDARNQSSIILRSTECTFNTVCRLFPNSDVNWSDNHRMQRSGGGDDFTNGRSTPAAR
ncbi:hypothetical protein Mal65_02200 [Crateriforma conspicua]|nr:hypothetical protein Mal65_02200 [Crateriforma conspicua]